MARAQWTLKDAAAAPELRALVAKAAERAGMPVSAFVAETLRARAVAILKDEPAEGAALPARPLPDLVAQLVEMQATQAADQAAMAAQLAKLGRGRWRKR